MRLVKRWRSAGNFGAGSVGLTEIDFLRHAMLLADVTLPEIPSVSPLHIRRGRRCPAHPTRQQQQPLKSAPLGLKTALLMRGAAGQAGT